MDDAEPTASRTPTPTRRWSSSPRPWSRDAGEGAAALSALRARVRAAGGTAIGAGIHPDGAFGDVEHVDEPRYDRIVAQLRGLIGRTPTCALHVHVGMPDAETAIRVFNGLREHLPLLQALAANSPFWHGRDSGLATARAQLFRGYPRAEIPRAFASYDDYAETVAGVVAAGDLPDYTFLWWDIRPHPRLGTVEVRAMDSQSALWSAAGLAALVHALARAEAAGALATPGRRARRSWRRRSPPRATGCARGCRWTARCARRREVARAALERARPHAAELGSGDALEGIERILGRGQRRRPPARRPRRAAGWRRCWTCSSPRPRSPTDRRRRCRRSSASRRSRRRRGSACAGSRGWRRRPAPRRSRGWRSRG